MCLNEVKLNNTVIVSNINCKPAIKQRLLDLGLVNGTLITPIFTSPFGNPTAYEFRGNIMAMRDDIAKKINIKRGT